MDSRDNDYDRLFPFHSSICIPLPEKSLRLMNEYICAKDIKNLNMRDSLGLTPLKYIIMKNNEELLKLVLENGDLFEIDGQTVYNAASSNYNILKMLLEFMAIRIISGEDPNSLSDYLSYFENDNGETPLSEAARMNKIENMVLLLKCGAGKSINKGYGFQRNSLLHSSITFRDFDMDIEKIRILIEYGADVDAKNKDMNTPLHIAIKQKRSDIVKILLENDADIRLTNMRGWNALQYAVIHKNIDAIKLLIDWTDDPGYINSVSESGSNLLHVMCWESTSYIDIMKLLIDKGCKINGRNDHGNTPLISCAISNNIDHAELLLKNGADINAQNHNGNTPLHMISSRHLEMIKLLLMNGADYTILNENGKDGLHLSVSIREELIEKYSSLTLELKEPDE